MKGAMMAACAALILPVMSSLGQGAAPAPKPPAAPKPLPTVSAEDAAKIGGLIGNALRAKPAKPRKVLVFSKCEGFVHGDGIVYGNKALEVAAAQTGAFQADFSTDYAALDDRKNLFGYDAVVLNNTTRLKTQEHPLLVPNLIEFVKSGRGLCVIHAGADNFYEAPEAAELVGGQFDGHPWGGGGTWAFKLDDPSHPLNQAFAGKGFKAGDEIYQQQSPFYNRAKLRVLVSLDFTDKATAEASGQKRADNDYAVSWIRPYGKGRVFYTSFGHDQRTFLDPVRLTHILDGVQYTLGDRPADDTPEGLSDADLARIRGATLDTANEAFALLQDILAHTGHAQVEAANRAKLAALLKDPAASAFGKKAVLRALLAVGAPADAASVTACLKLPETRDWAATLLAGTPGKAADQALAQALAGADAPLRCTLLAAAAIRKNAGLILPYAADADAAVATAALSALGRLGTEEALATLAKPAAPALEGVRTTALAACLGNLSESGSARAAARAAKPLFADAAAPAPLRAAAAKALLLADDGFFADGLKDACPSVRQTVIRAADGVSPKTLAASLKTAAPADQVALLAKLAARDAKAQADAAAALLASEQVSVVIAALRALTKIGSAEQVPAIFALTAREGAAGAAAKETLADLRAKGAGQALIALAQQDPAKQPAVLALLGERTESALVPQFEPFLKADQPDVRKEAWKALGKTADDRTFAQLVAWLPLVRAQEQNQAEAALRTASKNVEPAARAAALAAAWGPSSVPAKKVLAGLMAGYSDAAYLPLLSGALADTDSELRETALRALADWPSMAPFATLKQAATEQADAGLKTVALRGAIKLATANAGPEMRARLVELFKAVPDDRGRTAVADALFKAEGLGVFATLQALFGDAASGAAAKKTYVSLFDGKIKSQTGTAASEIAPKNWKANASHNGRDAKLAFDRNPGTRWSSNHASEKGMWYTLDLGESAFISEVTLDTEKSGGDTPNGFEVFASGDGKSWSGPVAQGDGSSRGKTVIPMAAQARHLKFVTTGGRPGLHWSIHEIVAKAGLDQKKVAEIAAVADSLR
jgi:type 1 glutamine amidotransferase